MPIQQKHYDKRGRYTGETLTQTHEEQVAEQKRSEETGKSLMTLAAVGAALALVYYIITLVYRLLAEPAAHAFPHNLFAYFYHYFFRAVFSVASVAWGLGVFLYSIPAENFQFIKSLTRYTNLNTIFWLTAIVGYIGIVGFVALGIAAFVVNAVTDTLKKSVGLLLALVFGPALVWVVYAILEKIFQWVFR